MTSLHAADYLDMKRAKPLGQEPTVFGPMGVLCDVLKTIGAGQHIYIPSVCKQWKRAYRPVVRQMTWSCGRKSISPTCTYWAVAFQSLSMFRHAMNYGLAKRFYDERVHSAAGFSGDIETLQAAEDAGLLLDGLVICAAAKSKSVIKVRWLLEVKGLAMDNALLEAASEEPGNLPMLQYFQSRGARFHLRVLENAAKSGDLTVTQWLMAQFPMFRRAPRLFHQAAYGGNVELIKWLGTRVSLQASRGHGYPYIEWLKNAVAAGHKEMLQYLVELDGNILILNNETIGWLAFQHISVLKWLYSLPSWREYMPPKKLAEEADKSYFATLETLIWVHELTGEPWDVVKVWRAAVCTQSLSITGHLKPMCASMRPEQLTEMLSYAGFCDYLEYGWESFMFLVEIGTPWPPKLHYVFHDGSAGPWGQLAIDYAQAHGCTSELPDPEPEDDEEEETAAPAATTTTAAPRPPSTVMAPSTCFMLSPAANYNSSAANYNSSAMPFSLRVPQQQPLPLTGTSNTRTLAPSGTTVLPTSSNNMQPLFMRIPPAPALTNTTRTQPSVTIGQAMGSAAGAAAPSGTAGRASGV